MVLVVSPKGTDGLKMTQFRQDIDTETVDFNWKRLYQIGGTAALIVMAAALIDIISALLPGGYVSSETVTDWFTLFQNNWLLGLRDLGLLDIIVTTLNVPLFFALYGVHRRVNSVHAAFAAVLTFVGTAILISNNVAFPMFTLSREYAAATTEAQKNLLAASGQALLARGAHSSPGTFMGYLFTDAAAITMGFVMLRGGVFNKLPGWFAILGFLKLLTFNTLAAFAPAIYDVAMIFAGVGGLFFIATYALIGSRLVQLGLPNAKEDV
jgi:hypothetical protein